MRRASVITFLVIMSSVLFAEITILNENDKHTTVSISTDGLGVIYNDFTRGAIRSTRAINQGSGFYYFEFKRQVDAYEFGFGVGTSTVALDNSIGRDDQSFSINMNGGLFYNNSGALGTISTYDDMDTWGMAVDYRGTNPILYILGIPEPDPGDDPGVPVILYSYTLDQVTDPLFIMCWGWGSVVTQGVEIGRINAGDNLGPLPYTYDPYTVMAYNSWYYGVSGMDVFVAGWGERDPGLNVAPTIVAGLNKTTVIGNPVTITASASDTEDGDLSANIAWSGDGQNGAGASWTFTPSSEGDMTATASVTDSSGHTVTTDITVTVINNDGVDNDGDGLTFAEEEALGTEASVADTDGDGLLDGKESVYDANPLLADTDGDDMGDAYEALKGLLPNVNDAADDNDGDGANNLAEHDAGTHPLDASDTPTTGVVVLNSGDAAAGVSVSSDGLSANFSFPARGVGHLGVRSDVSIAQGDGWFYFEGTRTADPGDYGFGVATTGASLTQGGGVNGQSVGVYTSGDVYFNGSISYSFTETASTTTYGIAVDYSGINPVVYPIITDADGESQPLAPVTMTGVTDPLHIYMFAAPGLGTVQRMNAGADPTDTPFVHAAGYEIFTKRGTYGSPAEPAALGAEQMGSGWGADHAYTSRHVPMEYDPVALSTEVTPAGEGLVTSPDGLTAAYTIDLKMAVRANTGMIGEFRYWEASRIVGTSNIGQGFITAEAFVSPYCCVTTGLDGAPPSMSLNSGATQVWRNLMSLPSISYDYVNTEVYGFAVDYRGNRPIVYIIVGDALLTTLTLDDMFTPIYPMLYGNDRQETPVPVNSANFGGSAFTYDVKTILDGAAVDTSDLILGWGDANDGETPVITGQPRVTVDEEGSLELTLAHLDVTDPENLYTGGTLSLTVGDGLNYTRVGNTITPVLDFDKRLVVPVTVDDGRFTSKTYDLIVIVNPVNDQPSIDSQVAGITFDEDTSREIVIGDLNVSDVDNTYPNDFTVTVADGTNYTHVGNVITPVADYNGSLTVPVTVSDGDLSSGSFNLSVTIDPVNDPATITAQSALATDEDTALTLLISDFTVEDVDNGAGDLSLHVQDGTGYSRVGNGITPAQDFYGALTVNVLINDGTDDSDVFEIDVTVNPINDPPEVDGQEQLKTRRNVALTLTIDDVMVDDPDNSAGDFSLAVQDGIGYSHVGNVLTPDPDFVGDLTVPVILNDGIEDGPVGNLTVNVCIPPIFESQPIAIDACLNETESLSVSVSGPGPFTYQWRRNGVNVDGETSSTLTFDSLNRGQAGAYDCVVSNGCDSEISSSVLVTVKEGLVITEEPQSTEYCPGDTIFLTANATGSEPISYQWYKDDVLIPLATASDFLIEDGDLDDGGVYTCTMSNLCGDVTTRAATISFDGPLVAQIDAPSLSASIGSVTFTGSAACAVPNISHQWRDVTRGEVVGNEAVLVIETMPTTTTVYEYAVTDGLSREVATARVTLLVPEDPAYLDYNGDGCSSIEDLHALGTDWTDAVNSDPNGDGVIDVRDLLYINISNTGSGCE